MMKKKGRMKMKLQKMLAAVMATSMVFTAVPVMNGVNVSAARACLKKIRNCLF